MSPFLVYLLFQADSISAALTFTAVIAGIVFCVAVPTKVFAKFDMDKDEGAALAYKMSCVATWVCPFLIAAAIFMPSTKTIAAMIVLPKVTSPQAIDTMSKESRDLYQLAKQALVNLADDGTHEKQAK